MDSKNLTIIPPEGMEAYQEGNKIKFRPIEKQPTYEDVARELFNNKDVWRLEHENINKYFKTSNWYYLNNSTSEKQAQKLLAINKLMNVAKYLNGGWKPKGAENKYFLYIDDKKNIDIIYNSYCIESFIYFKSEELARKAVEILGEETIRLIFSTDW